MNIKKITSLVSAIAVLSTMLIPMPLAHAEASTLEVGNGKEYTTINAALAKAKEINPQSEDARVTINIDPGNYEEQVRIDNLKYITLQQTPETEGKVNLSWYYCTGYCASNTNLSGLYDPDIDWSLDETWNGYNEGDEKFTKYEIGQVLNKGDVKTSTISYYDKKGVKHKDAPVASNLTHLGSLAWGYDKMAALIITRSSSDITVRDLNIVNTVPVMKIQAEIDGHLTPEKDSTLLDHNALSICSEDTPMVKPTADIFDKDDHVDKAKYKAIAASGHVFTPGESAWLLRSSVFNERGHALASLGDRVIFENVRARGNQDSIWVSDGRAYFKNCTLIGGTDYIYGSANAVFDSCKLGFAGFTDYPYGNPLATPNTGASSKYGYLFFNCTIFNNCDNGGVSNFGGPWGADGQSTFYNTTIDDNGTIGNSNVQIDPKGWGRFGAENGLSRLYEYGTKSTSGNPVDLSKRVVNKSVEEGGTGMGTVLDKWQILEFNPRNYFSKDCDKKYTDNWDPMNFGAMLETVDSEIAAATITVPAGESTEVALPTPTDSNIEFHWASASTNAVVSDDGTKMTVVRPALGEKPIVTSVILYARDKTTGYGDKKEIPVTINATTDNTNVFNIPVTITQSLAAENEYTVTISKEGALIKEQVIPVSAAETKVTVENIPASASGISYDVKVVSKSSDFTLTAPPDGKTTINGVTGTDVPLNIKANKVIDEKVNLDIEYSSSDGNKSYDLIALAKAKGASNNISKSEVITVNYTLTTKQDGNTSGNSFIDLLSAAPAQSLNQSGNVSRFVLAKLGHWNQLDFVDSTQGYSGSSNNEHQHLNMCGKFKNGVPSNVTVTIDYKNQTIAVSGEGTGSDSYTFATFPQVYEKGKLNMGVYAGGEVFDINKVSVTYKREVTDDNPEPTEKPLPSGKGTYVFPADREHVTGGNQCDNSDSFVLLDSANARLAEILRDKTDNTKLNSEYMGHYLNYISGTNSGGTHPKITLEAPAGYYTVYLVGYNNDTGVKAIVSGETYYAEDGVQFAAKENNASYVLKSYKIDVRVKEANDTITFDSDSSWLPDSYVFVVDAKDAPPVPTAEATAAPTGTPSNTDAPDKETAIKDVKIENGNTVATLENITNGVVIAVKYNGNSISALKTQAINGNPVTVEGIEANKVMVWNSLNEMRPLCPAFTAEGADPSPAPTATTAVTLPTPDANGSLTVDFTTMSAVPEYTSANGQGFVAKSSAIMPSGHERQVAAASAITVSSEGAKITETNGAYLHKKNNSDDGDDYNNGGLIYRIDTGKPGAYHLEVEITGTKDDTIVAPTGMNGNNLTGTSNWDNCKQVPRTVSAAWNEKVWSYDFATGEDFIEIEIEPKSLASASDAKTVGVKNIKITPLENNNADDKPTIHILGDSTQKSYSFDETISAWGQTLKNYFDLDKVNVVNYSMGGRAMKSNYCEGRFDEILIRGKEGDFVFIHSAHNDETVSTNRFSRGAGTEKDNFAVNDANYNRWLDMYVEAIKARGMTPVLVTAMPRVNGSTGVPNSGFNPNSPANMRAKAQADPDVALAELYDGAKAYIAKLDGKEVAYIYNNIEAGETPAANAANGAKGDGTHYKEAAAKQWSRIILQSIYDQSVASTDTYTDKDIMTRLVSLMSENVQSAAQTGDWSAVFPEMASDVGAVDVVPNAEKQAESNYYYRNNIEKSLQLGLLHKDTQNLFKPTETITVGEFARGIEKAFGLAENSLTSYTNTYAELSANTASVNLMSAENASDTDVNDSGNIELMAAGDGDITVTVEQPTGGTVTVYNNSAFNTVTSDIPANVTANAKVSDNNCFTLTAPETIVSGTDNGGAMADGISANYVEFRNNNEGKDFSYTAKADGIITVYARTGNNKPIELKGSTTQSEYINEAGSGNVYGFVTFNVKKGETYQLYTRGGTGRLFGIKYESTDYPQSTTSLSVNSGDEIRVVAAPAENYVNGSILVNGEAKSTAKEYTFTAEGDTTVSATFIAEPALVAVTNIASDAALTRETMGAILYDAYQEFQKSGNAAAKENMAKYMSNNGGIPSPSDPNYDPNIQYEGSPYIPTVGWGALTDTSDLTDSLYQKVKNAYNLGLMRSEKGIGRGQIALGTELEPKAEVTRAKAAKSLVFAFILTQTQSDENQLVPEGFAMAPVSEIALPNTNAPSIPIN